MRTMSMLALTAILQFTSAQAVEADYGAWRKADPSGKWTRDAEAAVLAAGLPTLHPSDSAAFCPNYSQASEIERTRFWAGLFSIMARPESNFKPTATYVEPGIKDRAGVNVISRGLLQISQESANSKAYACGIAQAQDLHDPAVNLQCGAKIMAYWVKRDGNIAALSKPPRGGARYWSVLRGWRPHISELTNFTTALPGCRAKGSP
ncbi:Transglycosylase SLT domain [Achromobacter denitrificans]|nr:Transglycosylase SLT domain [Achromobacter denitrificans]